MHRRCVAIRKARITRSVVPRFQIVFIVSTVTWPSPQSEMMMKAVSTDSPETMFPITLLSSPNEPIPKGGHYPAAPTSLSLAPCNISQAGDTLNVTIPRDMMKDSTVIFRLGLRRSQPNTLTIDIGEAMDPDSNLG